MRRHLRGTMRSFVFDFSLVLVSNAFAGTYFEETFGTVSLDLIHWTVPGMVSCPMTYTAIVGVRI